MESVLLDAAGHRRSPATMPGYHRGRPPRNKGEQYPADPPTVEEIVAVMRTAGGDAHGERLRALIVLLYRKIAAVGADSQGKQELEPALAASATLVVDVLDQCAEIGELQHVLAAGLLTRAQVHAEFGDVVVGRRLGRTRDDEITIFDSSGTAPQDVAAAIVVYENACATGRGLEVKLTG